MQPTGLKDIQSILRRLRATPLSLCGKDVLLSWELSLDDIRGVLLISDCLKALHQSGLSLKVFETGLGVSLFRDKSTRTRYSYGAALNLLGLEEYAVDEGTSQIAHGETIRETANMISFLTEVIGIRDDVYLGRGDAFMRDVCRAVQYGFDNGILPSRPGVINLQSDIDHPTQSLSDLATLAERFGGFENLAGRRFAVTWAYSPSYGKPLSVPQGLIGLLTRFGMDVVLAHPEGYDLLPEVISLAERQTEMSGGGFTAIRSMEDAFKDADVVYPKSWAPFQVMEQRSEFLSAGAEDRIVELEKKCLQQNSEHIQWECTAEKMSLTKNGEALYMHCLPADISGVNCLQGEVSEEVFSRYMNDTYHEAGFKPYVIAAMILLLRLTDVPDVLQALLKDGRKRIRS